MPPLRDEIAIPLNQAIKLIDAMDFLGALVRLADADSVPDKTPAEECAVAKYLAVVFLNEPMPDAEAVKTAYNRQIASHGCPQADQQAIYEMAMQLNYQFMDYDNVIRDGAELQKLHPLSQMDVLVLAAAYLRTGDAASAAVTAKAGIDAYRASGKEPDPELAQIYKDAQAKLGDK
jgi:DNA-binding SARP family transcriptional activator